MNDSLTSKMLRLFESACIDKPLRPSVVVKDGCFNMTITGNRDQWTNLTAAACVPSHAEQKTDGETLMITWPSIADQIFGEGGLLSKHLRNYQPRPAQLHMARLVQRSIEMRQPAMIEAGTGTGKSFAYAAVCMAMNKKVVIAAPTLALQMQLYKKDIPFLQTIFPGKKVELAMGKTNYVCKSKTEDQQAGAYKLANQEFINWYEQTATGNLLEFPLQLTTDDQKAVAVDDDCTGKHCSNYGNCFYYDAKGRRNEADVVITNHSLVALHTLIPTAKLLPSAFDVLVIDEAHQLPDYVRNALGSEITVNSISKVLDKALKQVNSNITIERELRQYLFSLIDSAQAKKHLLVAEVSEFLKDKEGREVGIFGDHIFKTGQSLSNTMYSLAADIWPEDEMPNCPEDVLQSKAASRVRRMADNVYAFSDKTQPGEVRYINVTPERNIYNVTPFDVSEFIGMLAGYASKPACIATPTKQDYTLCARCGRTLTADKVAILDGQPYGPDCIQKIDALGDADIVSLQDWLEQQHAPSETQPSEPLRQLQAMPVIFCSATIAAPDMSSFMRECGIANGLQMQALSPFDYQSNSLLYVPAGNVPQPNGKESQAHQEFVSQQIQELVQASKGGAFLLFTSFSAMNNALRNLRQIFDYRGWPVLVQGEYPKLTLVEKFKASGKAVLFATKSFWEGVDIQGEALRLVVIDKLPFEAPNPINTAQEAALREYAKTELGLSGNKAEWYPFNALRVPKMITDLKQGSGRLIRTAQDYGVIAILDPRIRTTDYGRRMVLPSLPPAQLVDELEMVKDFYRRRMAIAVQPMPDIVSKKTTVDFALVEELPF